MKTISLRKEGIQIALKTKVNWLNLDSNIISYDNQYDHRFIDENDLVKCDINIMVNEDSTKNVESK